MRIAVMTGYTPDWQPLGEIAVANRAAYCERHGYGLLVETGPFDAGRHPSWSKILFLLRRLPAWEWIWWTDADLLVLRQELRLETILDGIGNAEVVIQAEGHAGVHCGSFLVHNSPRARRFLVEVYRQQPARHPLLWEQSAVAELLPAWPGLACVLPEYTLAAYLHDGSYRPGQSFALEFVNMSSAAKLAGMRAHHGQPLQP